ncbi:riboflavin synthase [Lacicoccus alkaliphilus]|uniref:Riboflavin synthase n=1 Tax=Lacicoccus alkaliphilus DSM 16010 TaxID=1123231 RepID=A0A1M7F701_9BACL|nr:riboflavin synthase [Salinicoccus alkaliphilus]SHL99755.1 riboflavin synthase alpha chain [Salinicoccus alkaliphilus DSM 16010]
MFTGLIEEKGRMEEIRSSEEDTEMKITHMTLDDIKEGDSIAVNGACLTAYDISPGSFKVTMINETKRITSLDGIQAGDAVNLERAVRLSDRLGGHLVSGHVDGTGEVTSLTHDGNALVMKVECPKRLMKYMTDQGSVTIDGTSLTLFEVDRGSSVITLNLIPETLERTILSDKVIGDKVNIEADQIVKYVEHLLKNGDADLLKAGGLNV